MKSHLLVLLLFCQTLFAAESLPEKFASSGQLILTSFASAPFPHFSRTNGHQYKQTFFPAAKHYSDSTVAIFVPKGFRDTGRVDFVIHFHGWQNTVAGTLQRYALIEQLMASGKNAVLLVPEGPQNASDSSGGKLEDVDGFKRFILEAETILKQRSLIKSNATVGNIILSGHSGGYQVMSSIVDRGGLSPQVKEVWLFDALYAQADKFLAWADQTKGRLLNIYTDNGGTKARTEELMTLLKKRGTGFLATTDDKVTQLELQTNQLIFLHTDLVHNEVVDKRKTFQQFLESSCLDPLAGK